MLSFLNVEAALRAGAIGGTAVFVLFLLARNMKLCSVNYLELIGSLLVKPGHHGAEMVGFLLHLFLSILIGMGYAAGFGLIWQRSFWWGGFILSIPHIILATLVTAVLVICIPHFRKTVQAASSGEHHHPVYDLIILISLHVIYGITLGSFYHI